MDVLVLAILVALVGSVLAIGALREWARHGCAPPVVKTVARDAQACLGIVAASVFAGVVIVAVPWAFGPAPLRSSDWLWALILCALAGADAGFWLSVKRPVDGASRVLRLVRPLHVWIAGQDAERALLLGGGGGSLGLLAAWAAVTWRFPLATIADGALGGVAMALIVTLVFRSWATRPEWPSRRRLATVAGAGAVVGFAFAVPAHRPAPLWALPLAAAVVGCAAWWLYGEQVRARTQPMTVEQFNQTPLGRRSLFLIGMPLGWIFYSGPYLFSLVNEGIDITLGHGRQSLWPVMLVAASALAFVVGSSALRVTRLRWRPPLDLAFWFGVQIIVCLLAMLAVERLGLTTTPAWLLMLALGAISGFFSSAFLPARHAGAVLGGRHKASTRLATAAFVTMGVASVLGAYLLRLSWDWVVLAQVVALVYTLPFLRMLPRIPSDAPEEESSAEAWRRHWRELLGPEHLWSNLTSGLGGAVLHIFYSTYMVLLWQAHADPAFRHGVVVMISVAFLVSMFVTSFIGRFAKDHGGAVLIGAAVLGVVTFVSAEIAVALHVDVRYVIAVAAAVEIATTLVTIYSPNKLHTSRAANRASLFSQEPWKQLVGGVFDVLIGLVVIVMHWPLNAPLVYGMGILVAVLHAVVMCLALAKARRGGRGRATGGTFAAQHV